MKIDRFYIVGVLSRVKQMLNYTSPVACFHTPITHTRRQWFPKLPQMSKIMILRLFGFKKYEYDVINSFIVHIAVLLFSSRLDANSQKRKKSIGSESELTVFSSDTDV